MKKVVIGGVSIVSLIFLLISLFSKKKDSRDITERAYY